MRQTFATTLFCVALTAGVVGADVLVTTDGTVVETQGPWQQRGKMVVFTLENGQLSALRVADVDFEATKKWSAELEASDAAATAPAPASKAKARLVLTDADVARAQPALEPQVQAQGAQGGDGGATAESGADPALDPSTQSPVRVIAWEEEEPADGRGRRIFGTVRNDGNSFATDVGVEVTVYDDDGAIAGTRTTAANASSLRPGESTTFSLQFPDVFVVGAARFRVTSLDLDIDGGEEGGNGDS